MQKERYEPTKIFRNRFYCPSCGWKSLVEGFRDDFDPYKRSIYHFTCGNCEVGWEIKAISPE